MKLEGARGALDAGLDVRRPGWTPGVVLRKLSGVVVKGTVDAYGEFHVEGRVLLSWEDTSATDWESTAPTSAHSIVAHPIWPTVRAFFGERPHELRGLEVRGLSHPMSIRLQRIEIRCCTCGKPIRGFRRRQGAPWSDLYFSPACPSAESPGCSRGAECRDEVDRIRSDLRGNPIPKPQLGLFGEP